MINPDPSAEIATPAKSPLERLRAALAYANSRGWRETAKECARKLDMMGAGDGRDPFSKEWTGAN